MALDMLVPNTVLRSGGDTRAQVKNIFEPRNGGVDVRHAHLFLLYCIVCFLNVHVNLSQSILIC